MTPPATDPVADGEWHTITGRLVGCHALEVVAGVGGRKREGQYALIHAIAVNTFDPRGFFFNFLGRKNRIRATHAYYRGRGDRLELQWERYKDLRHEYVLQIRTRRTILNEFGNPVGIGFHVTSLWHDHEMERYRGSQVKAQSTEPRTLWDRIKALGAGLWALLKKPFQRLEESGRDQLPSKTGRDGDT